MRQAKLNKTLSCVATLVGVPFHTIQSGSVPATYAFSHFLLLVNSLMDFHYDKNHGDQICHAATKPLQTSLSTKKIKYVHACHCHSQSFICV